MLTREHGLVEYRDGKVWPDRLAQKTHRHYIAYAEQMLDIYRRGAGRTREELQRDVRRVFADEPDCPPQRISAFCKLLDDVSAYDDDKGRQAAALRRRIFRLAGPMHPLVSARDKLFEHDEQEVKTRIADELGMPWEDIDARLFADVIPFHRLMRFDGYPDAPALLSRYNVAQTQVALYSATRMTLRIQRDFKTILRYIKLARLLHQITRDPAGGYRIDIDGPASVLRETRRYGVHMAKFLPALLACRDWEMEALIRTGRGGWKQRLILSPRDGLKSHLPEPEEFDSSLEMRFAAKWGDQIRDGWRLERESEVLHHGQRVFIPDFTFVHEDGRRVLLEIVAFWTPEYLEAKLETLKAFSDTRILLAIPERIEPRTAEWPGDVVTFKSALKINDVLAHLSAHESESPR